MSEYSPEVKKILKDLVGVAYEQELKKYLMPLSESFKQWEKNEIDSLFLTNQIHKFHNGISKKLFRIYTNLDSSLLTARAVALELIPKNKISDNILAQLHERIEFYKNELQEDEDDLDNEY